MATRRKTTRASHVRSIKAAAVVVGALAGGALAFNVFGRKSSGYSASSTAAAGGAAGGGAAIVLRQGQSGSQVKQVQQALLKMGGAPAQAINESGGADGRYGAGLVKALQAAGAANPYQLTQAAVAALVKKGQQGAVKSKALPRASALPTSPASKVALARQQGVVGASGKAPVKTTPARQPAAAAAPTKLASRQPIQTLGLPLRNDQVVQLRQSLLRAITAKNLLQAVSVLGYMRHRNDWFQVAGSGTQAYKVSGRTFDVMLTTQFGATDPYLANEMLRMGLGWNEFTRAYIVKGS